MATNDKPKKTETDNPQLNWRYGSLSKVEQRNVKKWLSAQRNRNESISQVILHMIERHGYKDMLDFEVQRQLFADLLNVGGQTPVKTENTVTIQEVNQVVETNAVPEPTPVAVVVDEIKPQQEAKNDTQRTTIVTEALEIDGSDAEKRVENGEVTVLPIEATEVKPSKDVEDIPEPKKEQGITETSTSEVEIEALSVSNDFDDLLNSADLSVDLDIED